VTPAEAEARDVLGARFAATATRVAMLPTEIDADEVWFALAEAALARNGHGMFPAEWTRARDAVLASLRRVIRRHPSAAVRASMLRDLDALRTYRSKAGPIDFAASTRAHLWGQDRASLGWVKRGAMGRPPATWRAEALGALRRVGVEGRPAELLLDAAGITAPKARRTR